HIRVQVAADQAGNEPVRGVLRVFGKDVKEFAVSGPEPFQLETTMRMRPGTGRIVVALLNPVAQPGEAKARALHLKTLEVEGPFNPPAITLTEPHKRLMTHKEGLPPREAARAILGRFATRAF